MYSMSDALDWVELPATLDGEGSAGVLRELFGTDTP